MRVEPSGRIMTWTLDRPEHGNGLDEPTLNAMETALAILEERPEDFGCLVVAGHETVFSTGLDGELLAVCLKDRARFAAVSRRTSDMMDRLERLPMVTLALDAGECRLGGLELALACDIVIAGEDAQIADGHLAYDAMPGSGGTRRLPARTGYSGALRFLLEAPTFDAKAARQWGIVDEVTPAGGALSRGEELSRAIAARAPSLVHAIKASLRAASPPATDRSYLDAFRRVVIERLVPG